MVALARIAESVDTATKSKQRLVDVGTFNETLPAVLRRARSIMLSVAMVCGSLISALRSFCETLICRTAWDRDEVAFASVGDIVRYSFPRTIMSITS